MASRDYVVGLPVVVSIDDNGLVEVEVDMAELAASIYDSTHEGEDYDDETLERDSSTLRRFAEQYTVRNEGFIFDEEDESEHDH